MLQKLFHLIHCLLILVSGGKIYLGDDDEEGYFKKETKSNVLLCHFLKAHIGTNNDTAKVRS